MGSSPENHHRTGKDQILPSLDGLNSGLLPLMANADPPHNWMHHRPSICRMIGVKRLSIPK